MSKDKPRMRREFVSLVKIQSAPVKIIPVEYRQSFSPLAINNIHAEM